MFETEASLVNLSIQSCQTLTNRTACILETTTVLREVNVGFGIADIVVTVHNNNDDHAYAAILNKNDIIVYNIIEDNKRIYLNTIISATRIAKKQINLSLTKLISLNYIEIDGEYIKLKNSYKASIKDSIAIEAKLKDWKRALHQAYRYKWFACRSYVLLDKKNLCSAEKNIDQFKDMGVGLLCADYNGFICVIYEPDTDKPVDKKMAMLLNEKIKEYYS
jgi:hypothetical protein